MQELGKQAVSMFREASSQHPPSAPGNEATSQDQPGTQGRPQNFDQAFRAFGGTQSFEELEALGELLHPCCIR